MGSIRDIIVHGAGRYDQSDPEGLTATYADDAVLTAPPGARAVGRQAILDYWVQLSNAFSDKAGEVGRSSETADIYFGEITFRGTNTGDLTMPDGTSIPPPASPWKCTESSSRGWAMARSSSTTCSGTRWR